MVRGWEGGGERDWEKGECFEGVGVGSDLFSDGVTGLPAKFQKGLVTVLRWSSWSSSLNRFFVNATATAQLLEGA